MTLLRGRAHIKIDPKGRLSLPASFRASLGGAKPLFITNSVYQGRRHLDCYTKSEWEKLEKKMAKMPNLKPEVQAFQRFYVSSVEECQIDSQGRILIAPHLREYASLLDNIVMVGVGHKIELWNEKDWSLLFTQIEKDFERVTNILSDIDEGKSK
jgi:MraZ protein